MFNRRDCTLNRFVHLSIFGWRPMRGDTAVTDPLRTCIPRGLWEMANGSSCVILFSCLLKLILSGYFRQMLLSSLVKTTLPGLDNQLTTEANATQLHSEATVIQLSGEAKLCSCFVKLIWPGLENQPTTEAKVTQLHIEAKVIQLSSEAKLYSCFVKLVLPDLDNKLTTEANC